MASHFINIEDNGWSQSFDIKEITRFSFPQKGSLTITFKNGEKLVILDTTVAEAVNMYLWKTLPVNSL